MNNDLKWNKIQQEDEIQYEYKKYQAQWIKEHISPERFFNTYMNYLNDKDNLNMTFDDFIFEYGFEGELYPCYDEWLDNHREIDKA